MIIYDRSTNNQQFKYIRIPNSASLVPSGDFTLEFFKVVWTSVSTQTTLYNHYNAFSPLTNNRSLACDHLPGTGLRFVMSTAGDSGSTSDITYDWTPTLETEYDLCFERSGTTGRIYLNGSMVASGTKSGALYAANDDVFLGIGRNGDLFDRPMTGYASAFRFTIGTARYATDTSYTVPSLPLPTQ